MGLRAPDALVSLLASSLLLAPVLATPPGSSPTQDRLAGRTLGYARHPETPEVPYPVWDQAWPLEGGNRGVQTEIENAPRGTRREGGRVIGPEDEWEFLIWQSIDWGGSGATFGFLVLDHRRKFWAMPYAFSSGTVSWPRWQFLPGGLVEFGASGGSSFPPVLLDREAGWKRLRLPEKALEEAAEAAFQEAVGRGLAPPRGEFDPTPFEGELVGVLRFPGSGGEVLLGYHYTPLFGPLEEAPVPVVPVVYIVSDDGTVRWELEAELP